MRMTFALTKLIVLILFTFIYIGCSQDPIDPIPNPYEGCCGTELRTFQVEDYVVYIPNIITPNGDGINDVFYPICNVMKNGKFAVGNYFIYNDTSKLVFVRPGLNVEEAEDWGFKGIANKRPTKPEVFFNYEYTGKFKYSFHMAFLLQDGTEKLIFVDGEACVVRCDDDAHIVKDKNGCYFPVQGLNGTYTASLPTLEENCIK